MITSQKATQQSMTYPSLSVPNAIQTIIDASGPGGTTTAISTSFAFFSFSRPQLLAWARRSYGKSRHMSGENKADSRRFTEEIFDEGNLDVLDELVPPEWVHHESASPEEEHGPEGAFRQRREISEPLKGNAKTPKVTRGPVGERVRRLAGARDLRPLFEVRTRHRIFEILAIGADGNVAVGEIALDGSEVFGETPAHLSRIEVEIDSSASLHAGVAGFVDEMRDGLGLRPTGLAKFELGLSAALNPSGASILDLKQRTEPSNEKAGG